jgi:methylase of polypeptide subunit release factors
VLRVKDQDALIARVETEEDLENFPFGLMLWASAVALTEAIPHGEGRRLLELGAGVGLAGLVARTRGWDVIQTDYDGQALALCQQNAVRNGITGTHLAPISTLEMGAFPYFPTACDPHETRTFCLV